MVYGSDEEEEPNQALRFFEIEEFSKIDFELFFGC